MTTTDPQAAILRAILDDPADDLPRLAYADLMEERGDDARAEFVRVQLELARLRRVGCHEGEECNVTGPCDECVREVEAIKLEYRERELFVANAGVWTEDLPEQLTTKKCPYCAEQAVDWETGAVECRQCDGTGLVPDYDNIDFRRGFVARVEMTTDFFLVHARALFSRHPVTEVVLVDREPMPNSGGRSWWDLSRVAHHVHPASNVPSAIFSRLTSGESVNQNLSRNYPAMAATLADLSRACVRHGRAEAGLPQLEEGSHDKVSP